MNAAKMVVCGWGIYSDQFANASALTATVQKLNGKTDANERAASTSVRPQSLFPDLDSAIHALDEVSQHAFRALHEALSSAETITPDRTALLLLSTWGPMDNTVGFLDSMLDADGRYASPRHFTRSVYSTVASHAAIYFGIHGPCETLAHGQWPICCILDRAADLLTSGHVDYVVACWADQASAIAKDLCRRSVVGLDRKEFSRFTSDETGYGAVAIVLKRIADASCGKVLLEIPNHSAAPAAMTVPDTKLKIHSFPIDSAVHLAVAIATSEATAGIPPVQYTETSSRGCTRTVRITTVPKTTM